MVDPYELPIMEQREGEWAAVTQNSLNRVICVGTGKGGAFKTSLTANAAGLCAAAGHRTLLIDLDPQGDLADDLGYFSDTRLDDGQHLAASMLTGQPLTPLLSEVRPNLDVVPGGDYLADVGGALLARSSRGAASYDLLAKALAPVAEAYDLIFIDTPPTDETLQLLALHASRWLVVPTKEDKSSIRAIQRITQRAAETRAAGHHIDLLGVVLVGVPTAAKRVRSQAAADITGMLDAIAPLFDATIRYSSAAAQSLRNEGILAHEMAIKVEGAEPFWKSLRAGTSVDRLPGTAPDLAADYVGVVEQLLHEINKREVSMMGEPA